MTLHFSQSGGNLISFNIDVGSGGVREVLPPPRLPHPAYLTYRHLACVKISGN